MSLSRWKQCLVSPTGINHTGENWILSFTASSLQFLTVSCSLFSQCPQPTSDPRALPGPRLASSVAGTEQSYPEIPESHRHLAVFQIWLWCVQGIGGQGACILQETESEEGRYCLLFLTWLLLRWHLNGHRIHLNGFPWHLHNSNNNQLKHFPYRDASLSSQKCVLFFSFSCLTENTQIYSVMISYTITLIEALFLIFLSLCRQIQNVLSPN